MIDLARALHRNEDPRKVRVARVVSITTTRLTLSLDGGTVVLPMIADTYAVNDTVAVVGGIVVGKVGSPPAPPAAPTPPAASSISAVVLPTYTGTYRGSAWITFDDLVYQGDYGFGNGQGGVFFGDRLTALGADPTRGTIAVTISRHQGGDFAAQAVTLWLVTQKNRPAGAPTRTSSTSITVPAVGGAPQQFALPAIWVNALLAGNAGGIGTYESTGSPYVVLDGSLENGAAFALAVNYWR